MDANQVVAYNLRRARDELGWTQEIAAERIGQYLGVRWPGPSFTVAEQSQHEGKRRREFDANEVLAFARAFNKPVGYFYTPPEGVEFVYCADLVKHEPRGVRREELLEAAGLDDRRTVREYQTAAVLRIVADVVERGDETELRALIDRPKPRTRKRRAPKKEESDA